MFPIYSVEKKKGTTCRCWNGARMHEFRADKAYAVRVEDPATSGLAYRGQTKTPETCCSLWAKWEKL